VAVDGEFVFDGQRAALVADFGERVGAVERRPRRRVGKLAHVAPSHGVGVVERVGRIDEIGPEFVERFEEAVEVGMSIHEGVPWSEWFCWNSEPPGLSRRIALMAGRAEAPG
jgi:hypothetical protein